MEEEDSKDMMNEKQTKGKTSDGSFIDGKKGKEIDDPADKKKNKKNKDTKEKTNDKSSNIKKIITQACGWGGIVALLVFAGLAIGFAQPLFLIGSAVGFVATVISFIINDNVNYSIYSNRLSAYKNNNISNSKSFNKQNIKHTSYDDHSDEEQDSIDEDELENNQEDNYYAEKQDTKKHRSMSDALALSDLFGKKTNDTNQQEQNSSQQPPIIQNNAQTNNFSHMQTPVIPQNYYPNPQPMAYPPMMYPPAQTQQMQPIPSYNTQHQQISQEVPNSSLPPIGQSMYK